MKTYEEMAQDALNRINSYETEKKIRRKNVTKIATYAVSFCLVAVLCVSAWHSVFFKNEAPFVDTGETVPNNSNEVSKQDKAGLGTVSNNADTTKPNISSDKKPDTQVITGDSTGQNGADTNPANGFPYFWWNHLNVNGPLYFAIKDNPGSTFDILAIYRPTATNITSFSYEGKTLAEWATKAFEENVSQDVMEEYELAYNAYLETVLPSAVRRLTENGIQCERATNINNGLTLLATSEELLSLPLEDLQCWSFDLASDNLKIETNIETNDETDTTGLQIVN